MSPGHLYHYFDSKEAIIEAIFESRLQRETAIVGELTLTPNADLITAICGWLDQRVKEGELDIAFDELAAGNIHRHLRHGQSGPCQQKQSRK